MPEGKNRIMICGPKADGTYIIEFKTAAGEALAISSKRCLVPQSSSIGNPYFCLPRVNSRRRQIEVGTSTWRQIGGSVCCSTIWTVAISLNYQMQCSCRRDSCRQLVSLGLPVPGQAFAGYRIATDQSAGAE
jgi:hypothetical protein